MQTPITLNLDLNKACALCTRPLAECFMTDAVQEDDGDIFDEYTGKIYACLSNEQVLRRQLELRRQLKGLQMPSDDDATPLCLHTECAERIKAEHDRELGEAHATGLPEVRAEWTQAAAKFYGHELEQVSFPGIGVDAHLESKDTPVMALSLRLPDGMKPEDEWLPPSLYRVGGYSSQRLAMWTIRLLSTTKSPETVALAKFNEVCKRLSKILSPTVSCRVWLTTGSSKLDEHTNSYYLFVWTGQQANVSWEQFKGIVIRRDISLFKVVNIIVALVLNTQPTDECFAQSVESLESKDNPEHAANILYMHNVRKRGRECTTGLVQLRVEAGEGTVQPHKREYVVPFVIDAPHHHTFPRATVSESTLPITRPDLGDSLVQVLWPESMDIMGDKPAPLGANYRIQLVSSVNCVMDGTHLNIPRVLASACVEA